MRAYRRRNALRQQPDFGFRDTRADDAKFLFTVTEHDVAAPATMRDDGSDLPQDGIPDIMAMLFNHLLEVIDSEHHTGDGGGDGGGIACGATPFPGNPLQTVTPVKKMSQGIFRCLGWQRSVVAS